MRSRRRKRKRVKHLFVLFIAVVIIASWYASSNLIINSDKLLESGYPKSLVELAERNPETAEFVKNYKNYSGYPDSIDISDEVEEGEIPLFLQWDERWGYEQYGDDFMAVNGCGPTCLSMVICGLGGTTDMNPYEVARLADYEGYYVNGSGSSWDMMENFASELGLDVHTVAFNEADIVETLQSGQPIICVVGPGDFTNDGHFIVLKDVDKKGRVIINDPNSKKNSRKKWKLEDIMPQVMNLWSYS